MSLLEKISVSISKEAIEKMVRENLALEGYNVKKMEFDLEDVCMGYGPSEYTVKRFSGITWEVEKKWNE